MAIIQGAKLICVPKGVIQLYFKKELNLGVKLYSRLSVRKQ